MNRKEILDAALQAITTDRQTDYGTPENSFSGIADYWSLYLSQREGPIKPHEVGIMLLLMKIKRSTVSPAKADSYVDMVGYAGCAGEIASAAVQPELPLDDGRRKATAEEMEILKGWSAYRDAGITKDELDAYVGAAFPPPPEGREWHNPDGLTPEQVGVAEGWRLCLKDERACHPDEKYTAGMWVSYPEANWCSTTYGALSPTYRTKAPLP